jgi:sortase A
MTPMSTIRGYRPDWRQLVALAFVLLALHQLAGAGYIALKAQLAQFLIANSWDASRIDDGHLAKPWPWADTWPIARLRVPRHDIDLFVLWGATGNALAFGPGYEVASAMPGEEGVTLIGGHRDTHFKFLQHLQLNTLVSVQLPSGQELHYQVSDTRIVDTEKHPSPQLNSRGNILLLVTCYPFNTLQSGGSLRYVVSARPVASALIADQG